MLDEAARDSRSSDSLDDHSEQITRHRSDSSAPLLSPSVEEINTGGTATRANSTTPTDENARYHNVDQDEVLKWVWGLWRLSNIGQLVISTFTISGGAFVLARYGNNTCFPAIYRWILVQIIISILQMITSITILALIPSIYDNELRAAQRARQSIVPFNISRFVTFAFISWQLVGLLSLSESTRCKVKYNDEILYTVGYCDIIFNVALLLIYAGAWLYFPCALFIYNIGYSYSDEGTSFFSISNRNAAPQNLIDNLERSIFDPKRHGTSCSICLVEFEEGERDVTQLSCGHSFHFDCISNWLQRNGICPECRLVVTESSTNTI